MDTLFDIPTLTPVVMREERSLESTRAGAPDHPPAYGPCLHCGLDVLTGMTDEGMPVALDPHQRCYVVLWLNTTPQPHLRVSAAYPVHQCRETP